MKKAWIENDFIRDIANGDPVELFHPSVAANYSVDVPDDAQPGWGQVEGVWVAPPPPDPAPEPAPPAPVYSKSMTPIRFKLMLGQSARMAIRQAVAYDGADAGELTKAAILNDWWDILNDKTLEAVSVEDPDTIAALGYLVAIGFMTESKKDEILLGVPT